MTTVATSISDTPTEILERILDFLHDDHPSLYSASLVSREWVSAPRYHLFKQTVIKEYFVPYRGRLMKENVHSFLSLAQSEHCTILPAIQYIVLMFTTPELIKDVVDVLSLSKAAPSQVVYVHLAKSKSISWTAHAFQSVHDFTFNMAWYELDDEAWRLITSFPSLRTLAVYTKSSTTITLPPNISLSAFHNLKTLRLKLLASEELFDWIDLDRFPLALETLDLRIFRSCHRGWGPVKALNLFLKGVSDTLKHLSLGIDTDLNLNERSLNDGPRIDLSPLSNLSSIFFRTHDMRAVCDSLASLSPSSPLEVLTVHAFPWIADRFNEIKECDCVFSMLLERFAGIMEGKPFVGIQMLNLDIPEGLDIEADLLTKLNRKEFFTLSSTKDDDDQPNTLRSIGHLIYRH